ncbi:MAG: STAS domain-containing protein, partial [Bacteroidota bacterium]
EFFPTFSLLYSDYKLSSPNFIDSTGIKNFSDAIKSLQANNIIILLSGVQAGVRSELDKNRISFMVGKANIFDDFDISLKRAKAKVKEFC